MFFLKKQPPQEELAPEPTPVRYLISAAGVPNYGDEFITRAWLQYLAEVEPDSEVWLDCITPSHAAHLFAGCHPHLHTTCTAWQLVWFVRDRARNLDEGFDIVRSWTAHLGTPREDLGILQMREADSIHLLGGGYLNSVWPAHTILAQIALLAKCRPETKLYATGLGITPLVGEDIGRLTSWLGAFDHVEARDRESAGLLGVPTGADDAFLGFRRGAPAWRDESVDSRLFVCLQEDVVGRRPEVVEQVVSSLLESGAQHDEPLTLVESIPPEDSWALDLFREAWAGEVRLLPFMFLWQRGLPAPEDALWVTTRFHTHLLAASLGARGLFIDYGDPFYEAKHGSLVDLGTGWSRMDVGGQTPTCATANPHFPEIAAKLTRRKVADAAKLYGKR